MLIATLRRLLYSILSLASISLATARVECRGAELYVGGATVSITPDRPVALAGQMHTRIARDVESPVMATALALESRDGDKVVDQAVLISCDLVAIDAAIIEQVRQRIKDRIPGFAIEKLVLNATHTHTAPVMKEGDYEISKDGRHAAGGVCGVSHRRGLAEAAVKAWESRKPGRVGWGLGHAVVAQNRRSVYADGRAQMYGPTDRPDFRGIEGSEDQGVEVLFFWDREGKLLATAINVACPSQEVEGGSAVNADFWHDVRESLRSRHGKDSACARLDRRGRRSVAPPDVPETRRGADAGAPRTDPVAGAVEAHRRGLGRSVRRRPQGTALRCGPSPQGRDDRTACQNRLRGRGRRGQVEGRYALQGPSQPPAGGLAPGRREPLRTAEGRLRRSLARWSFT